MIEQITRGILGDPDSIVCVTTLGRRNVRVYFNNGIFGDVVTEDTMAAISLANELAAQKAPARCVPLPWGGCVDPSAIETVVTPAGQTVQIKLRGHREGLSQRVADPVDAVRQIAAEIEARRAEAQS